MNAHLCGTYGPHIGVYRYNRGSISNADLASAALNKWLKPRVFRGFVFHSFRHSIRDRVVAVECPSDIIDAISG